MSAWRNRSIVIWATAFMVLATWAVMASAVAEEGGAEPRISQPAPQWKVGDYWRYTVAGRTTTYQWQVGFGPGGQIPGTCDWSGRIDTYTHFTVDSTSDGTWFKVDYFYEYWQNGTYQFKPQGYPASTIGNYKLYEKSVTTELTPMKYRKTDLARGDYTYTTALVREYTWTNYGKWTNITDYDDTVSVSYLNGPWVWYGFPLDFSKTWPILGTIRSQESGQLQWEPDETGYVSTRSWNLETNQQYTTASGKTDSGPETVTTPQAGSFNDCYKIHLYGYYDSRTTGTMTTDNQPQNIDESSNNNYFDTDEWYSNTAGFTVNYNSTQPDRGLLLSSYHYISIPPNYQPKIKTLGGQDFVSLMTVAVREGVPTPIELGVMDEDVPGDTLNWTVVSITGSQSNPQGAKLMDETPQFTVANPVEGSPIDRMVTNRLTITAKQPKTVDRDEYTIKVNVNDGNDGGDLNFSFKVKVLNNNDKPYVAMPIPDIWMRENSTMTCTTWKMTDIFKDQDKENGILDPLTFTAVVTSGPWVSITTDNDTGTVTISVPDYAPDQTPLASWDANIKFTCTDSGSGNPINKSSNFTTAKLHIEHVNHDPFLMTNGTELADEGLYWAEDTTDTRVILNNVFFDPDVKYADDVLKFTWSGQKNIVVKDTTKTGRISLSPVPNWNGKETIKFTAKDNAGRSKELRLECNVWQVPDAPAFCETDMDITWDNEDALRIKEAVGPNGPLNKLQLNVVIKDADELMGAIDPHSCRWYVNDSNGNPVYDSKKFIQGEDDFTFQCDWTRVLANAYSSLGQPYEVKCVAKDSFGVYSTYIWNVTVINVNRPPLAKVTTPVTIANESKTYDFDTRVYFDGWNSTDLDELTDNLTFIWKDTTKSVVLKQDRGQAGAQFSTVLAPGKHVITLTVQDTEGAESTFTFTVNVNEQKKSSVFGIFGGGDEGLGLMVLMGIIIAIVAVVAILALVMKRKKPMPPPPPMTQQYPYQPPDNQSTQILTQQGQGPPTDPRYGPPQ